MTRAIVDQKLSALLSAEARLERTERTSPAFDEICAGRVYGLISSTGVSGSGE
jgi:hypothetical protein